MPRNSAGTFALVAGNPVVDDTVVEASWANDTLNDIAAALTDSLSRSGSGGMTVPMEFADGTVGDPAITFGAAPTTGLYRAGTNDVRFSLAAADLVQLSAALIKFIARVVDGATAVGVTIDTANALTMSGAKLLSILNATVEKFSVDKDGSVSAGTITGTGKNAAIAAADGSNGIHGIGGEGGGEMGYVGGNGAYGKGADENGDSYAGSGGRFEGGSPSGAGASCTGGGTTGTGVVAEGGSANGTGIIARGTGTECGMVVSNDGGTRAPLNIVPHAAPSTLSDGDIWVETTSNTLKVRLAGSTYTVITD